MSSVASNIFEQMETTPEFCASSVSTLCADPSIDAGDIISVTWHGETCTMPVFQQTLTWSGLFTSELSCDGNQKREVKKKE